MDFIEVQACEGGCVGGPLNVQNLFVARVNLKNMVNVYKTKNPISTKNRWRPSTSRTSSGPRAGPAQAHHDARRRRLQGVGKDGAVGHDHGCLSGTRLRGMRFPNCRALAEDIIRGLVFDTDCIVKLRERVKSLAKEIVDLARKLPQSYGAAKGCCKRRRFGERRRFGGSTGNSRRKMTVRELASALDLEILTGDVGLARR